MFLELSLEAVLDAFLLKGYFFIVFKGLDCCAETSISFHYTLAGHMNQLYSYLNAKKKANSNGYAPLNFTEIFQLLYMPHLHSN